MKLIEALNLINSKNDFGDLMTVYVKKEWSVDSDTIIVPQPENGSISPVDGHNYFLEVFIIKDWLADLGSSEVSLETCNRMIQYAINDA
jgi:hypothetical protein